MVRKTQIEIRLDAVLDDPRIAHIFKRHELHCKDMTPPESQHRLDVQELRALDIDVYVAWRGDDALGIGALKSLGDGWGEIKSMHVLEEARGQGVGNQILEQILARASELKLHIIGLETGITPNFQSAIALYHSFGFTISEPFGDYLPDPNSLFMIRKFT